MSDTPQIRFLSLFVPDLADAARRYEAILGVPPRPLPGAAPRRHPFSRTDAVVFDLGGVEIALYQADATTTHAGDVGIGLLSTEAGAATAKRAAAAGARVFPGLRELDRQRKMLVFMTPDRHFFEVVSGPSGPAEP